MIETFVFIMGVVAGIVASIAGFGIGSFLTPILSLSVNTKSAIASVALPHFFATAYRLVLLRKNLDRHIFMTFGLASTFGGLCGALIHSVMNADWLSYVLGALLLLAGITGLLGKVIPMGKETTLFAGFLSGTFGGLVGNQGGIRAAALLNFKLNRDAFIAVSTASALLVDGARLPVYLWTAHEELMRNQKLIAVMLLFLGVFMLVKPLLFTR